MKRYFMAVRLIVFIGVATALYMSASSSVGFERDNRESIKNTLSIGLEDSHKIWNAVNSLQDNFDAKDRTSKAAFIATKVNIAKKIIISYSDLNTLFDALIVFYNSGNRQEFFDTKEKIAQILRPIWTMAARQEQARRSELGWAARIKEDFIASVSRAYNYFTSFFAGEKIK